MLIGIARKEEGRVSNTAGTCWQQRSITKVYPLIEIGYDRSDCQAYIRQVNKNI
ncbi:hypothetical protein GXP67_31125 [Rhodocytophaga rosea]|uniref:Uncharacterized protein n=1 Tax=Rhodocytophaga rosea TaxID=2704465 RepID=A0A6C0GRR9_9BACT|nr:hypothetical protein [Rhodocytophaga rosea]QHT70785.1 hypothetical protein GXP67_31125 [Rhodocytophaga rosea]